MPPASSSPGPRWSWPTPTTTCCGSRGCARPGRVAMAPPASSVTWSPPRGSSMPSDRFSVEGQVIVVTGGLGQLGSEYAAALLDAGARVALLDLRAAGATLGG